MTKKTFKIGEYARGGVIVASVDTEKIVISVRDWDFSTGSGRSANQNNAEEIERYTHYLDNNNNLYYDLSRNLNDITSYYYSEKIIDWLESKSSKKIKTFI